MPLRLEVYVKPRASKARVLGMRANQLDVAIAAAPVDGAANEALIECLAEYFDVPKSAVTIVRGRASRRKLVDIEGSTQADLDVRLGRTADDS